MRLTERIIETALVLAVAVASASVAGSGRPEPDACPAAVPPETVAVPCEEDPGRGEDGTGAVVCAWNYVPDASYGMRAGRTTWAGAGL